MPLRYQFVDELAPAAGTPRISESAANVAGTMDVSTLEPDVRYLALWHPSGWWFALW